MKRIALISDIHSGYMNLDIILSDAMNHGVDEFILS